MYGGDWTPFTRMSITNGNYASPPHLNFKNVSMSYVLFYLQCQHSKPRLHYFCNEADLPLRTLA